MLFHRVLFDISYIINYYDERHAVTISVCSGLPVAPFTNMV